MRASQTLLSAVTRGVKTSFWRGGTSKGLIFNGSDVPGWHGLSQTQKENLKYCEQLLQPFYRACFGSPDPYGRQLNGMGGGISSLSKSIITEVSRSKDADIDYYFVQIGIKNGLLDMAGNCGNMTAAVGPFAVETGLLKDIPQFKQLSNQKRSSQDKISIRLRNMNTNKIIVAHVPVVYDNDQCFFNSRGSYELDGVSQKASPITLSFLDPAGSKTGKALPTGRPIDVLSIDGRDIQATLTDISNPGVFIDGREVGWNPDLQPEQLTADTILMTKLEDLRRQGATKMGLDPNVPSIPKIVLLYPPHKDDVDIRCQALSMEQAHKAVPVTLSLNLGVAAKLDGTIPYQLARKRDPSNTVVGHPSGKIEVGAEIVEGVIKGAKLIRTARWLMNGYVNDSPSEDVD